MAAKTLDAQLQLTVVDAKAVPDVHINPVGHVIAHLTQGFDSGPYPNGQGNAITATSHLPLQGGLDGTTFGYVQVGRINFYGAFYAGRIPSEGSVGVQVHVPPALPSPVLLDAFGTPPLPWFLDPLGTSFVAPSVHASWGDHPSSKVPSKVKNTFRSNVDNFLFHLIDDRDFWTLLTAQDPGGALRFIAHFRWQLRYDFQFKWINGEAKLRQSKSFIKVHERNTRGRPREPDIQGLLTTPADPRANVLFGNAINLAFKGPRGPNRSENTERFPTVPVDFWG